MVIHPMNDMAIVAKAIYDNNFFMLFVLSWFEVVKLPSSFSLECIIIRLVPIDATIIEIVALYLLAREVKRDKLYATTYDATFQVVNVF